jgi:hypothetical protein
MEALWTTLGKVNSRETGHYLGKADLGRSNLKELDNDNDNDEVGTI